MEIGASIKEYAMAATLVNENAAAAAAAAATMKAPSSDIVEFAKCECCGLIEECTQAYIHRVRERYQGRWICGLCSEAVKDEIARSEKRRIGTEEALNRHMNFCKKFRSARLPPNPTVSLISAVKQLLLRSLDSPRSTPTAAKNSSISLLGSKSCYPTLNL